jgi:hypothetical protein
MLLAEVRKLVTFVQGQCDPAIGAEQHELAAEPKRSINHRVHLPEEYLAGAVVIATLARLLSEAGFLHGETLYRDAVMLALESKIHARRAELWRASVGDFHHRTVGGEAALSIIVRVTKTHERTVIIKDERVLQLLTPLLEGAGKEVPLFRTADNKRLGYYAVGVALDRTAALAVGERGGANIMRRSATKRVDGHCKKVGPLLGHKGEETGRNHYTPNQGALGLKLIQDAVARATRTGAIQKDKRF